MTIPKDVISAYHLSYRRNIENQYVINDLCQHNPPISDWMLRKMFDCLDPSRLVYLQIGIYKNGYLYEASRHQETDPLYIFEIHFLPQKDIFRIISETSFTYLEVGEDGIVGNEDVMLSNIFLVKKNA